MCIRFFHPLVAKDRPKGDSSGKNQDCFLAHSKLFGNFNNRLSLLQVSAIIHAGHKQLVELMAVFVLIVKFPPPIGLGVV